MATVTSSPSSTGPTEEGSSSRTTSFPEFYSTDEGLRKLGTHLRSLHGVKVRSGIEHDKRVEYFKGKRLIECLLEAQNWPKTLPKITEKGMALELAATLLQKGFFHRSEKSTEKKGHLIISPKKVFEEMGYFTWMFSGNMMWSNVATVAVIVIVILFTLLPVWPQIAKKLLWYVAVTFLLFTVTFILLRFLMFLIMWIFGYEFWLFPRLFDESLGFVDSFKPIYVFDNGSPGQGYYRVALLVAIVSFIVWAARQPTEFDGFLQAQKEFVDDLYSGNLLTDYSQSAKDTLDRNKRVPDLEDLLRQIELDEIAAEATKSYKPSADTNDEEQQNQEEEEEEMASGDDEGEDGDGWQEKDEEVEQDEDEDEEERE